MVKVPKYFTYVPGPVGGAQNNGCVDWDRLRLYAFAEDFYSYDIGSQNQLNHGGSFTNINLTQAWNTLDVGRLDGRIYTGTTNGANLFIGYNAATGVTERSYNDVAAALAPVGNMRMGVGGGANVAVGAGLNSGQGTPGHSAPIFAVNMDTLTQMGPAVTVPETNTSIAPGNVFLGRGPAGMVCATALGINGGVAGTVGIYTIALTASAFTVTRCGGHVAADFGFAGTLNFVGYPTVDQTDGHIIACVQSTSGSIALCKFSSVDGHIVWQRTVGILINLASCRVVNGFIHGVYSTTGYLTWNTITNTQVLDTISPAIIGATSQWFSDDVSTADVVNVDNNGGHNPQWGTFGLPPAPMTIGGGILRRRS